MKKTSPEDLRADIHPFCLVEHSPAFDKRLSSLVRTNQFSEDLSLRAHLGFCQQRSGFLDNKRTYVRVTALRLPKGVFCEITHKANGPEGNPSALLILNKNSNAVFLPVNHCVRHLHPLSACSRLQLLVVHLNRFPSTSWNPFLLQI